MKNLYCKLFGHKWIEIKRKQKKTDYGTLAFIRQLVCLNCDCKAEDKLFPVYHSAELKIK